MIRLVILWNTVKYLRLKQVIYQLWYRLKLPLQAYIPYNRLGRSTLHPVHTRFSFLVPSKTKYLGGNTFLFLNVSHTFSEKIDWSFMGNGKLWNYNLQYFDFLHDEIVPDKSKQRLIEDFSQDLISRKIRLEPYPISLRIINWIIYYSTTGYRSAGFDRALKTQIDFLTRNLEYHIGANHLLENYFAMLFAGYALHDEQLTNRYFNLIQVELKEQILEDGGHYERSGMYHSIILGKVLLILDMAQQNRSIKIDERFINDVARKMSGWLKSFRFSNKTLASINDATGGIAHMPEVYEKAAGELKVESISARLTDSGFRKMENINMELVADVGNISPSYQPGHSHSGMLGFCLNYKQKAILVDTGVSTYQAAARRLIERKTLSHNTVTIFGEDQSQVWSTFRVGKRARLTLEEDKIDRIVAIHDGYKESHGILHRRNFLCMQETMTISDELQKLNKVVRHIEVVAHFHFDYTIGIELLSDCEVRVGGILRFSFDRAERIDLGDYEQALGFNRLVTAQKIRVHFTDTLRTTIMEN